MGIFGILSQAVTQRRREIGIRIALGAGSARLVRLLVGQGVRLAALGAAVGTIASLFEVRALAGLLFGLTPFDARVTRRRRRCRRALRAMAVVGWQR